MGYIYKFESPSGKVYVGQTVNPKRRFKEHMRCTSNSCPALKNAIQKYKNEMKFDIIDEVDDDELDEREQFWIEKLNTLAPCGYNLVSGGRVNKKLSEEVKRKISEAVKGKPQDYYMGTVKSKTNGFAPTVLIDKKTTYLSVGVFNTREEAIEILRKYTKDPLNFKKVEAPIKRNLGCVYYFHGSWKAKMKRKYLGSFGSREEAEKCLQDEIENTRA